jgi:site-specific recombinase XerD
MDSLPGNDTVGSTKYAWKARLKRLCLFTGKTPDQLIEERKQDLKSEDPRAQHRAEMEVKRFLRSLEEEGKSPNYRITYFTAIRSFYKRNYLELKFQRREGPPSIVVTDGARAATKEEVRKLVEVSDTRRRALILTLKDTGLAESDAVRLRIKDLGVKTVDEVFMLKPPVPLELRRKKTKVYTLTFMGTESFEALKTTLNMRRTGSPERQIRGWRGNGKHEGILPEELTLESPLFRSYGRIQGKPTEVHPLRPQSITVLIRKAAIAAGIWELGFSSHALRRYYQTGLESAGVPANWVQLLMGHRLNGVEGSYSKPSIEMLREAYAKAYRAIAISEASEHRSRIDSLERQTEALILENQRLKQRLDSMSLAPSENELMNKVFSDPEFLRLLRQKLRQAAD